MTRNYVAYETHDPSVEKAYIKGSYVSNGGYALHASPYPDGHFGEDWWRALSYSSYIDLPIPVFDEMVDTACTDDFVRKSFDYIRGDFRPDIKGIAEAESDGEYLNITKRFLDIETIRIRKSDLRSLRDACRAEMERIFKDWNDWFSLPAEERQRLIAEGR